MFREQLINNFAFLIIIAFAAFQHVACIRNRNENAISTIMMTRQNDINSEVKFFSSSSFADKMNQNFADNQRQLPSSLQVFDFTADDAMNGNGIGNEIAKSELTTDGEYSENRFPLSNRNQYRYKTNNYNRMPQSSHQYVNNNSHDYSQHQHQGIHSIKERPLNRRRITATEHQPSAVSHYRTYQFPPFVHSNAIWNFNRNFPSSGDGPPPSPLKTFESTNYFAERQSPPPSPSAFVAPFGNYANTYGNYFDDGLGYRQPNYNRRATPPPPPPSYDNLQSYQIGELPPGVTRRPPPLQPQRPGYRPPPLQSQSSTFSSDPTSSGGVGNIASLLSSTFGQTPGRPFRIPFLNGFGGGGGGGGGVFGSSNALSTLLNNFIGNRQPTTVVSTGGVSNRRPLSNQFIESLEKIARNDELQCVPKVLCQMLGSPTRRQQLPEFVTSPTITNFIAALPSSSPALVFGRAALLGLSGGEKSCSHTYQKCSKSDDEVLYYLNNHRGGFFKLFDEPKESDKEKPTEPIIVVPGDSGASPSSKPPSYGNQLTESLGAFVRYVLSGYLQNQVIQTTKRRRRSTQEINFDMKEIEDYDDNEDEDDDLTGVDRTSPQPSDVEGRILHKDDNSNDLRFKIPFFPTDTPVTTSQNQIYERFPPYADDTSASIENGNDNRIGKKLKFPTNIITSTRFSNDEEPRFDGDRVRDHRRGKRINFVGESFIKNSYFSTKRRPFCNQMIFPDRTGTGKLLFDADGKLLDSSKGNPGSSVTRVRYQTKRPPIKQEDDPNIYVTNSEGVVDYYIDVRGRRHHLPMTGPIQ